MSSIYTFNIDVSHPITDIDCDREAAVIVAARTSQEAERVALEDVRRCFRQADKFEVLSRAALGLPSDLPPGVIWRQYDEPEQKRGLSIFAVRVQFKAPMPMQAALNICATRADFARRRAETFLQSSFPAFDKIEEIQESFLVWADANVHDNGDVLWHSYF